MKGHGEVREERDKKIIRQEQCDKQGVEKAGEVANSLELCTVCAGRKTFLNRGANRTETTFSSLRGDIERLLIVRISKLKMAFNISMVRLDTLMI